MGLDSVELLVAVEEEFDIEIPYPAAGVLRTIGDLVDLVDALVNGVSGEVAAAERASMEDRYREVIGLEVADLPAETRLVDLLEPGREARQWEALGIRGEPARPAGLVRLIWLIAVAAGLGAFSYFFPPPTMGLAAAVLVISVVVAVMMALTAHLRQIPDPGRTLGDEMWWRPPARGDRAAPRDQIFDRVRGCVVDVLGGDPSEVTEESRFVEDLRMD